ncbi:hypothetical protein [Paraburkholderia adhaesiva]|uniref:hypothetical protein n=1 Tax=Paraburkholderia adhaesiva TaxID=2883244 RepID=UPI001F273E90|nr:hypothetical protein [Paraburkholderia adhaesiva]
MTTGKIRCGICGKPFTPAHHRQQYCSEVCRKEARRLRNERYYTSRDTGNGWSDPEVRARRSVKQKCRVLLENGTWTQYRSIGAAFTDLQLEGSAKAYRLAMKAAWEQARTGAAYLEGGRHLVFMVVEDDEG